jgi:hypothetical protein
MYISLKVSGPRSDDMNALFSIYLLLDFTQPITEMITRSRKIFLGSRALPVRRAYNLTAICVSIV